jgi:hypothetical protein
VRLGDSPVKHQPGGAIVTRFCCNRHSVNPCEGLQSILAQRPCKRFQPQTRVFYSDKKQPTLEYDFREEILLGLSVFKEGVCSRVRLEHPLMPVSHDGTPARGRNSFE